MSSSSKGLTIGGNGGKGGGGGTPVAMELEKLGVEQLKAVKEQADMEVNLLQDSLNNIRNATNRLDIASNALHDLSLRPQGSKLFFSRISIFSVDAFEILWIFVVLLFMLCRRNCLFLDFNRIFYLVDFSLIREENFSSIDGVTLCAWETG